MARFFLRPARVVINKFSLRRANLSRRRDFRLYRVIAVLVGNAGQRRVYPDLGDVSVRPRSRVAYRHSRGDVFPVLVTALRSPDCNSILLVGTLYLWDNRPKIGHWFEGNFRGKVTEQICVYPTGLVVVLFRLFKTEWPRLQGQFPVKAVCLTVSLYNGIRGR